MPTNRLEALSDGGEGERAAALVYAGTMTMMGVAFGLLWRYASHGRRRHERRRDRDPHPPLHDRRADLRRLDLVALASAPACLAIIAALAVSYAPPRGGMMRGPVG